MRKIFFTIFALFLATLANFAIDNEFKNMLLNVDFDKIGENCYKINLETQVPYADEIKIVKKSDYNYYILLSETYAKTALSNINSDIISANVSLYPYIEQDSNNGYTKITLNTSKPLDFTVSLSAKTASKFPVMDLVKIAQLNQMYDKYQTTVKTSKTAIAQKPIAPAVAAKAPAVPPVTAKAPIETSKVAQKPAIPAVVPQKTAAQPSVAPKEVQKPLNLNKIPAIPAQTAQEVKVDITPAKPKVVTQKQPNVVKPAPAPKVAAVQPKIAAKPVQAPKKPVVAPKVAQAPVQSVKPVTQAPVQPAKPVVQTPVQPPAPVVVPQTPVQPKVATAPQEILPAPEILPTEPQVNVAGLYEKYPVQVIILICALLAFLVGVFKILSMKLRRSEKKGESIGLGGRPLYSTQEPVGEVFEEILDENIYASMPDFTNEPESEVKQAYRQEPEPEVKQTYHQELESAVPDFLEDYSEELDSFEAETPTIELVKEQEQVPFESAPEPYVPTPLAIEEEFSIDFGEEAQDIRLSFEPEEQAPAEIVKEEPKEPVQIKEAQPLKSAATSPIHPAPMPKTEPAPAPAPNVAKILSTAQVENDRGFYLADFKGVKSLVAYVMDNVFVIHSFKDAKIQNPQIDFRLSETGKQGDFYLVRVGDTKLVVKSEKEKMSLVDVA